jgi:hypothetical protein
MDVACTIHRPDGFTIATTLHSRICTSTRSATSRHSGILHFVLRQLLEHADPPAAPTVQPAHVGWSATGESRSGVKLERLAAGRHLVFDRPPQHQVQEALEVLVSRYDARWDGVVLDGKACPARGSARQSRMSMQKWLDSPFTHHLDPGKDEGSTRFMRSSRVVRAS